MQTTFDAVVLAGYDPTRPHPLTAIYNEPHKALVPIAGKPMIEYVVQALTDSGRVERVVIVGMGPEHGLDFGREIHYLPNRDSIFANAAQGVAFLAQFQSRDRHALLVSADVPLLTGEMVNWFFDACLPLDMDIYWGIVPKEVMEGTFPNSRRTYGRVVEGKFCNGELYLVRITTAFQPPGIMQEMIDRRKNVVAQARLLGWRVVFKYIFGRLTTRELLGVFDRVFQARGAVVKLPFAESGMDVDKPHQLEQVEAYLKHTA